MAGYHPYIIATLLMIYSHTTDADSTCNRDTTDILSHLREDGPSTQPDRVSSLGDSGKRALCAEVIGHLLGNELAELLGKADRAEPLLAQMYPAFIPRLIRIGGLGISKKMWYCSARNYKKTGTGNVGQIDGFFCAGSPIHRDRAYVLRPTEPNANEVVPVVELNNW